MSNLYVAVSAFEAVIHVENNTVYAWVIPGQVFGTCDITVLVNGQEKHITDIRPPILVPLEPQDILERL